MDKIRTVVEVKIQIERGCKPINSSKLIKYGLKEETKLAKQLATPIVRDLYLLSNNSLINGYIIPIFITMTSFIKKDSTILKTLTVFDWLKLALRITRHKLRPFITTDQI